MRAARAAAAMVIVAGLTVQPSVAEPEPEREAWKAEISAAVARARAQRDEARAEFERRRAARMLDPFVSDHAERARMASDQVRNDSSLRKGDIVSTTSGLFVFIGNEDVERSGADFVPLPPR